MKRNMITKYSMLALFSTSFIALNNCGHQQDSSSEATYNAEQNGSAADFAIIPSPFSGYPVLSDLVVIPPYPIESSCTNGVDDNGDGLTDCMDPSCADLTECTVWGPPLEEIRNGDALTIYPNGSLVRENVAFLNARGNDDDDHHHWFRSNFFPAHYADCWVTPRTQDPYFFVPHTEPLVAGPEGPIGPLLGPANPISFYGPRAGLINECEFGTDLVFNHMDDDNGSGAGASGDTDDEEGGINESDGGSDD